MPSRLSFIYECSLPPYIIVVVVLDILNYNRAKIIKLILIVLVVVGRA